MNKIKNILVSAAFLLMSALTLCSCGEQREEYDTLRLQKDIVGIWINEGGPLVSKDTPVGDALTFFEFTSDGKHYMHYIYMNEGLPADISNDGDPYHIEDNLYVNETDNTGAVIEINGDTMTMSSNSGSNVYKKLTVEEATGYFVYYNDEELQAQQQEFKASLEAAAAETAETAEESIPVEETSENDTAEDAVSEASADVTTDEISE